MIYEFIKNNYALDEPIFLTDFKSKNNESLRQEMKKLTDEGKLVRVYNGVYYQAYKTKLNTIGKLSIDKYIFKKYIIDDNKTIGYITGLSLANKYGFTTQNPSVIEICSNNASTKQRKYEVDGYNLIIYKPVDLINNDNLSALQFLDLMANIDKYSELKKEELKSKLKGFVNKTNVNFDIVKKYINLYPDRIYKNIYEGGLMNELL